MASVGDWQVGPGVRPRPGDYAYDLDRALAAVVGLKANVPADAFTAEVLGTERSGSGVLIEGGLVVTIGYLVTEAESIWLSLSDGRTVQGHVLGYDQETGFGLVQPLARLDLPMLALGSSESAELAERVVIGGAGGRDRSVAARIVAKQEFAGYWEYVLDEALFTAPAHPYWGGTGIIDQAGDLIGIGSLRLEQAREGHNDHLNMVVPIDLLKPIMNDLMTLGRPNRPARPWLGLYATEIEGRIVIVGLSTKGPAADAGLESGDMVVAAAGEKVSDLATFFRRVWSVGDAGAVIPLVIYRDGRAMEVRVTSGDRNKYLKAPKLH